MSKRLHGTSVNSRLDIDVFRPWCIVPTTHHTVHVNTKFRSRKFAIRWKFNEHPHTFYFYGNDDVYMSCMIRGLSFPGQTFDIRNKTYFFSEVRTDFKEKIRDAGKVSHLVDYAWGFEQFLSDMEMLEKERNRKRELLRMTKLSGEGFELAILDLDTLTDEELYSPENIRRLSELFYRSWRNGIMYVLVMKDARRFPVDLWKLSSSVFLSSDQDEKIVDMMRGSIQHFVRKKSPNYRIVGTWFNFYDNLGYYIFGPAKYEGYEQWKKDFVDERDRRIDKYMSWIDELRELDEQERL